MKNSNFNKPRKIWTLLGALGLIIAPYGAFAAGGESSGQQSMGEQESGEAVSAKSQEKMKNASAKEACKNLVDAAKRNDLQAFSMWSLESGQMPQTQSRTGSESYEEGGEAGVMGEDTSMQKQESTGTQSGSQMHRQQMTQIKDLESCGSQHIADNHAVVEAQSRGQKRLIPFVKEEGQWKFDGSTYMSFYRDMMGDMTS